MGIKIWKMFAFRFTFDLCEPVLRDCSQWTESESKFNIASSAISIVHHTERQKTSNKVSAIVFAIAVARCERTFRINHLLIQMWTRVRVSVAERMAQMANSFHIHRCTIGGCGKVRTFYLYNNTVQGSSRNYTCPVKYHDVVAYTSEIAPNLKINTLFESRKAKNLVKLLNCYCLDRPSKNLGELLEPCLTD